MHKECILLTITITRHIVLSSLYGFRRFLKTEKHLFVIQKKVRSKMINFEKSYCLGYLQIAEPYEKY